MARARKDSPAESTTLNPANAAEAFATVEARLGALTEDTLVAPDGEVAPVALHVLSTLPKVMELRDAWEKNLPQLALGSVDDLETIALAAWYADLVAKFAETGSAGTSVEDEATTLREGLLIGAEALSFRGLLDKEKVVALRKEPGSVAADLTTLAEMFTSEWTKVLGKTAVERKEVERAAQLGQELQMASTLSKAASGSGDKSPEQLRVRTHTLLVQAYDTCRRAVTFLRWADGDVESIVPALPKKRVARKAKSETNGASTTGETGVTDMTLS